MTVIRVIALLLYNISKDILKLLLGEIYNSQCYKLLFEDDTEEFFPSG